MDNLKIIYPKPFNTPTIFYSDGVTPVEGATVILEYENDYKLMWAVEYTQPYFPQWELAE